MRLFTRVCPVCGGNNIKRLHLNTMVPINGLDMSYLLAQCNLCGFHFAQELPEEAQYRMYYNELSKYDSQPTVSPVDRERINAAVNLCESLNIPKECLIIDLGCGFGSLMAALRDAGWTRIAGIDPAPQSSSQAKEQFGLDGVYQGTLADANEIINLKDADLICLMAVVEHLPELRRDLERMLGQLRLGARILVEVPALELFNGIDGEPFGELSLEHIQFFSEKSMRNLLASLGMRILNSKLLPLPSLHSGSLFVMAEFGGSLMDLEYESSDIMSSYLTSSAVRLHSALKKVPDKPFLLYGAGSHSARLIPMLSTGQRTNLRAVFDANVNLHGKLFDDWVVQAPANLPDYPDLPVLISSYRSEISIAKDLKQRFPHRPVQLMYHDA